MATERWRYHPRVSYGARGHEITVEAHFQRRDGKRMSADEVQSALLALAKGKRPNMGAPARNLSDAKRRELTRELDRVQRKVAEWQAKLDKAIRDLERYRRADLVRDAERRGRAAERQLDKWGGDEQRILRKLAPTNGKDPGGEIVLGAVYYGSHDPYKKARQGDIRMMLGIVMSGYVEEIGEEKL
jgi:hypothetical protein